MDSKWPAHWTCKAPYTAPFPSLGYVGGVGGAARERERMDIGNQIRERRQRLGLSQGELAQRLYVRHVQRKIAGTE